MSILHFSAGGSGKTVARASACELDREMRFLEPDEVRMKQNEGLRDRFYKEYSELQSGLHGKDQWGFDQLIAESQAKAG
ncbi:MAG TPA: hypothetical protein VIY49_30830 [Bryobacteraceae bacterium]